MIFRFRQTAPAAIRTAVSAALLTSLAMLSANAFQAVKDQVVRFEAVGDLNSAKSLLSREAEANSNDAATQRLVAEFLCRHGDAGCREAAVKWASLETDPARKKLAQRQLLILDYMGGKDTAADLQQYQASGGSDLSSPATREHAAYSMVTIPGPLPSFARMAALSPDLAPEDLLPALARNIVTNGYEASGNEALQQTEYLRLLIEELDVRNVRWLARAR